MSNQVIVIFYLIGSFFVIYSFQSQGRRNQSIGFIYKSHRYHQIGYFEYRKIDKEIKVFVIYYHTDKKQ